MLDREVVKEFLEEEFQDCEIEVPKDISSEVLVETFCRFVENDYYVWFKDNFKSFFNHSDPIWNWIRDRIDYYSRES